jgi:hypothetical protein
MLGEEVCMRRPIWVPAFLWTVLDAAWNDARAPLRWILALGGSAGALIAGYADELQPWLGYPAALTEVVRFAGISLSGACGGKLGKPPAPPPGTAP